MKPKRMRVLHISSPRPVTRDRRCPWCAVPVRAGERLRTVTYSTGPYAYQVAVCEACTLGEAVVKTLEITRREYRPRLIEEEVTP